jgi:hypothetical protein
MFRFAERFVRDYARYGDASQVEFTAAVNNNAPSGLSVNWVQEVFTFTATGSTTTLDFINKTAAGVAVNGLDQVSVMPVPEPAVGALLGSASALLALRPLRDRCRSAPTAR